MTGLMACGGVRSPSTAANGNAAVNPNAGPASGASSNLGTPAVVQVGAGQTAAGVDIAVAAPAGSPPPNAQVLGVAALGAGGSAFNTGSTIHRGASNKVILFGPGLNADMQVTIGGPNDIAISNVRAVTSTSGAAGIAFDAAVSGNAALGARTVYLRTSQNDITAFTGGLEVVP